MVSSSVCTDLLQYVCVHLEKLAPVMVNEATVLGGANLNSIIPMITALIVVMQHEDYAESAYTSFSDMVSRWPEIKRMVLSEVNVAIISTMVTADGFRKARSVQAAIKLLCHLDLKSSEAQIVLMRTHSINRILDAIAWYPLDATIQRYGCKILRCFVRSRHCIHRDQGIFTLSRNGAKDVAKAAMANHPSDKRIVYSGAEILLRIRDFEMETHRLSHSFSGID